MKRLFLSASVIALGITAASAQTSFGIQAGVINSNWRGDALNSLNNVVDLSNGFVGTKSKTGFTIGGYAHVPLSENFSFEPGISYAQKGYAMKGDLKIDALKFLGVNAAAKVQANYIDIPLVLKANVANGLSVYAGPQVSYLTNANLHLSAGILGINLINKKLDLTDNFNRIDMAVTGGVAYGFDNGLNIKAGYDYGLARLDRNENFKAYNRAIKFTVGYTF